MWARLGTRARAIARGLGHLFPRRGSSLPSGNSGLESIPTADHRRRQGTTDSLWVNIVSYEDPHAWILGKIARRLAEQLDRMGVHVDLRRTTNPNADFNHHVCYWNYDGRRSNGDTLMVTHIDTEEELAKLKRQLDVAEMGVCMSSPEVSRLAALGVPREKLCFISPGHDAVTTPRKIVIGITTRRYPDGRKRERMLTDLARRMPLEMFRFRIMGAGWADVVADLRGRGVEVDYWDTFEPGAYATLFSTLDYYLYTGLDEGSMGFVDAAAAGVQTIVTPQGFHLDAPAAITHPFTTIDDLQAVFEGIAAERAARVQAVAGWTFAENARRHLRLWEYLHGRRTGRPVSPELARDLAAMSAQW